MNADETELIDLVISELWSARAMLANRTVDLREEALNIITLQLGRLEGLRAAQGEHTCSDATELTSS